MPTVKYDVSNVDESGGFEHVQPGMYIGKISEVNLKDSKSGNGPMLEVILQPLKTADGKAVKVKDKKKQVGRVYTYVLLEHEPSDWKLKEFTKAVGLKDKGAFDTDKLVGKQVQMNLKPDTDLDDKYRPKVGKLLAMPDGKGAAKSAPEPEPDEEEEDGVYTAEDLEALDNDELIEAAAEFEIKKPVGKMTPVKKKKLIAAILEAQGEDEEDEDEEEDDEDTDAEAEDTTEDEDEDEEEDDEEEDEEEDEEDLEDALGALDRKGLKAYIAEHELDITVKKSMEDDDIREAIVEAMGSDEEEEDDEEETKTDYSSWSMDALKKEAQERGLSTKGSKKILVGRLTKEDEDDDNPF